MRARALLASIVMLSSACAVYPKKSEDFDRPTCEVYRNPLTLDAIPVEFNCAGDARGCLLVYTAIGPTTAVASGSIVAAGNGLYWLANRSDCSIKAYARRHLRIASH